MDKRVYIIGSGGMCYPTNQIITANGQLMEMAVTAKDKSASFQTCANVGVPVMTGDGTPVINFPNGLINGLLAGNQSKAYKPDGSPVPAINRFASLNVGNNSTTVIIRIDASAATEDTKVLLGDGDNFIQSTPYYQALAAKGGYPGIGVTISGTYGVNVFARMKKLSQNTSFSMRRLQFTANLQDYFDNNFFLKRSNLQGTIQEEEIIFPALGEDQYQPLTRVLPDFTFVLDPLDGLEFPILRGQIVSIRYNVIENVQSYDMSASRQ